MATLGKTSITELSLLNPLSILLGGTGATTIENVLKNLCRSTRNSRPQYILGFDESYLNSGWTTIDDLKTTLEVLPLTGGTIISNSIGSTTISSDLDALIIAPKQIRSSTINNYFPGIAFNHLWNYNNGVLYNLSSQAWIGLKLKSMQGSETSSLIFATKEGTDASDRPIERMFINPDGTIGIYKKFSLLGTDSSTAHIQFNSQNINRITVPSNGTLSFGSDTEKWFNLTSTNLYSETPLDLGSQTYKWKNIYTSGNIIISGNDTTPKLIFQRYTDTDTSYDWSIHATLPTGSSVSVLKFEYYNGSNWVNLSHIDTAGKYHGSSLSADKLTTTRTIWGLNFDGSGNVDGTLHIKVNSTSYTQGIRIYQQSSGYAGILLGGTDLTSTTGTSTNSWFISTDALSTFSISKGNYTPTSAISFGYDNTNWLVNGGNLNINKDINVRNIFINGGDGSNIANRSVLIMNSPSGVPSDIVFKSNSTSTNSYGLWGISSRNDSSGKFVIYRGNENKFNNTETEIFTIHGSGNIGINTPVPGGNLHISSAPIDKSPTTLNLVIDYPVEPTITLTDKNSPGIGFHVGNKGWGSIIYNPSKGFKFINNSATAYVPIYTEKINLGNDPIYSLNVSNKGLNFNASDFTGGWARSLVNLTVLNNFYELLNVFGTGNEFKYAYVGNSYSYPFMKWDSSGNFTFKNKINGSIESAHKIISTTQNSTTLNLSASSIFNELYHSSYTVTMDTVNKEWYIKISMTGYARPQKIMIYGIYNNREDKAIIETTGLNQGFIYRNCATNNGNIIGLWHKSVYDSVEQRYIFWIKLKAINSLDTNFPSSSATYIIYNSDNYNTIISATTTSPENPNWITVGGTNNNILISKGTLLGNASTATTATTATTAVNATNVTCSGVGSVDVYRNVWFSDSESETLRTKSANFLYNPATNILKVGSITGSALNLTSTTIINAQTFMLHNAEWKDSGYNFTSLESGTYVIQVTSGTNLVASGIMSIYKNISDTIGDEIPLHVYGTAGWRPYLRTYNNKLLISSNDVSSTNRTITIKIAKII